MNFKDYFHRTLFYVFNTPWRVLQIYWEEHLLIEVSFVGANWYLPVTRMNYNRLLISTGDWFQD